MITLRAKQNFAGATDPAPDVSPETADILLQDINAELEDAQNKGFDDLISGLLVGRRRLRFRPSLETRYRQFIIDSRRRQIRIGLLMAAALFVIFSVKDPFLMPLSSSWLAFSVQLFLIVPSFLMCAALLNFRSVSRYFDAIVLTSLLVVIGSLLFMLYITNSIGDPAPYETLVLLILYIPLFSGLRQMLATPLTLCIMPLHLYLSIDAGLSTEALLYQGSNLLVATLMGTVGGISREILDRRTWLNQAVVKHMASHDTLTNIYNRRSLMERYRQNWRQAHRYQCGLGIIMIDIDHFKSFNDRYGHLAGDRALSEVAKALNGSVVRPLDALGRFGGEEFMAITYDVDHAGIAKVCENLCSAVRALAISNEKSPTAECVTVSIGALYIVPDEANPDESLIEIADQALYDVKHTGRNNYKVVGPHGD